MLLKLHATLQEFVLGTNYNFQVLYNCKGLVFQPFFFANFYVLLVLIRIVLGLLFISSALLKLFPLSFFELVVVDFTGVPYQWAELISRALIGFELALGLAFLTHWKLSVTLKVSLVLLIIFTFQTLYLWWVKGSDANCGCFGKLLPMGAVESTLKNVLFIGLALFLFKNKPAYKTQNRSKPLKFITPFVLILALLFPFVLFPTNAVWRYIEGGDLPKGGYPTKITVANFPKDLQKNLKEGDHIVPLFSVTCSHCKTAAYELFLANKRLDLPPIQVLFWGEEDLVDEFFTESNTRFSYTMIDTNGVAPLTNGIFPTIYYIEQGKVKWKWRGGNFSLEILEHTFPN